jgi:hypothetical protein
MKLENEKSWSFNPYFRFKNEDGSFLITEILQTSCMLLVKLIVCICTLFGLTFEC